MRHQSADAGEQSLLPLSLELGLRSLARRSLGISVLLITGVAWYGLITWSAGGSAIESSVPAGLSPARLLNQLPDIALQLLGLAATIGLFAPTFWGFEILSTERLKTPLRRLLSWPIAVLSFATGLAGMPAPQSWPLSSGFGGVAGEYALDLARTPLGAALSLPVVVVALLFGCLALVHSCGIGSTVMLPIRISRGRRFARSKDQGPAIDPFPNLSPFEPSYRPEPESAADAQDPRGRTRGFEAKQPPTSRPNRQAVNTPHPDDGSPPWWEQDMDRTADNSEEIARRFAPKSARGDNPARRPQSAAAAKLRPESAPANDLNFNGAPPRRQAAERVYRLPSTRLLAKASTAKPGAEFTQGVLRGNARLLEDVLNDFGIKGKIVHVSPGPVITRYELEPQRGIKAARVIALADDIARSMSAVSARIAVVPGKNAIGIELPNIRREPVCLRELVESEAFTRSAATLPLVLGRGIGGEVVVTDLARLPHLLIAGTTGSGKSVGINTMILSLLYRLTPAECRLVLIDPKMLELSVYNGIPHLLTPVITEASKALAALEWAVREMEERYKRMSLLNVRSIETFNNALANARRQGAPLARTVQTGFNAKTGEPVFESANLQLEHLPTIVIVIDELADLMTTAGKEIEAAIQRLSQMARAAGIHLIAATQRPSVDVVTGTIKANLPGRLSYKVATKIDSRTILGEHGAEQLLGQGDMLFNAGIGQTTRVHGPYVSEEEIEAIVAELCKQGEPNYLDEVIASAEKPKTFDTDSHGEDEDLYDRAVATVLRDKKASASHLQRKLAISAARAADLVERMETEGVVSPANGAGRREVRLGAERH